MSNSSISDFPTCSTGVSCLPKRRATPPRQIVSAVASLEALYKQKDIKTFPDVASASISELASCNAQNANNTTAATITTQEIDISRNIAQSTSLPAALSPVNFALPCGLNRNKITWRCGLCGYYLLSIDQDGKPIPFTSSAFGTPLQLGCPQCLQKHTNWESASPFDGLGVHINLRNASKLSTRSKVLSPPRLSNPYRIPTGANVSKRLENSTSSFAKLHHRDTFSVARGADAKLHGCTASSDLQDFFCRRRMNTKHKRCYYCKRCGRRLLRVDADGELVPMNCSVDGDVLPILCSGCGVSHNEWEIGPFKAQDRP